MHSRNFEFLRPHFRELADLGGFAETYAGPDPSSSLTKLRLFDENLVKAVFAHHRLERPYNSNLNDLLNDDSFRQITPTVVMDKINILRIKGNHAAHGTLHPLQPGQIESIVKEAHELAKWFALSLGLVARADIPDWQGLPGPEPTKSALQKEKKAALQKLAEQEVLMGKLLADLEEARAQADAARKSASEKAAILNQAQQAATALDFNEEETRLKLIDEMLIAAGWDVAPGRQSTSQVGKEVPVLHQPTASGKGFADYVLWGDDGKPLGVGEAKKTAEDAEKGRMQAKYYADGQNCSAC